MVVKRIGNELRLIGVAIVLALLLVVGHLILAKSFEGFFWVEYTAAAIPFIMFLLCLVGILSAAKSESDA